MILLMLPTNTMKCLILRLLTLITKKAKRLRLIKPSDRAQRQDSFSLIKTIRLTDYVEAMACKLIEYPYVAAMMDVGILNDCLRTYPRNIPRDQKFGQFAINIASGGTLGVRREVFDDIGLFDESFNFSTNDVEFCCRAYYAGYKLELVDEAVLNYRLRQTARDNFIQGLYYGRGNFAIAQRYPEIRGDQRNGVGRLVIDAGSIMCNLLSHYESRNKSAHDLGKVLGQLGCRCTQVFNNI